MAYEGHRPAIGLRRHFSLSGVPLRASYGANLRWYQGFYAWPAVLSRWGLRRENRLDRPAGLPRSENQDKLKHVLPGFTGPVESRTTNSGSITISESTPATLPVLGNRQSQMMWPMRSRGMCTVVSAG